MFDKTSRVLYLISVILHAQDLVSIACSVALSGPSAVAARANVDVVTLMIELYQICANIRFGAE